MKTYATDLTAAQWAIIEPLIPPPKPGGRPRRVEMRRILDALFYITRTGCAWRLLPHEFPPWSTVYDYFRQFRTAGVWSRIHDALRAQLRQREGRDISPSAAIIDSQSVKTTEKGGLTAMMPAKRSMAASVIWSSIRWA